MRVYLVHLYLFRNFAYVTASATAMFVENRRFHAVFVACALVYPVVWMVRRYLIFS